MDNILGVVFTPLEVTQLLAEWAIHSKQDTVLDLGIGEGAFVFSCYERLLSCGATKGDAARQIYGSEIDKSRFDILQNQADKLGVEFPNLSLQDFFEATFPQVDVVIGNPPYVRRRALTSERVKAIRHAVLSANSSIKKNDLSQLTDLYIYFLLKAATYLKSGGRLAVIIADSWLNVRYGKVFRYYLKDRFEVDQIVAFDQSIFDDALVKPVLLLATKNELPKKPITFTRVKNSHSISDLTNVLNQPKFELDDITTIHLARHELDADNLWGTHFKISQIQKVLAKNEKLIPLGSIANSRIGLQTLAKDFFALTHKQVEGLKIEDEFLTPLIHSITDFDGWVIDKSSQPLLQLFFCNKSKEELKNTRALEHIQNGEQKEVIIKGRDETVIGYHNKPRIQQDHRPYWYDLQTSVRRRGKAAILLPRLVYKRFKVLWNQAEFVPGGAIIEILPKSSELDIRLLLALLNSTFAEVLFRGYAQMYGGGTYTLGVSQTKLIPILDVNSLTQTQQNELIEAYEGHFLTNGSRNEIDSIIWDILQIDPMMFESTLENLHLLSTSAKLKSFS